ncbi:tyrosine-type recombinase/integrase [Lentisphaerae bacterium WC36]|nr:tyrosine-type recombinase/integrase [Lentisphaerae bacterium WC36]
MHSLRHTFAYVAALSNIPLPIVQGVLGHMTTDMTKHYMNHASKKDKAKHLSKLPNYLADCEVLPAMQNANCSFDINEVKNLIKDMNSENWQINRFKLLELLK